MHRYISGEVGCYMRKEKEEEENGDLVWGKRYICICVAIV